MKYEEGYYPNIDLARTGVHLKKLIEERGYTVRDIQELLHLSCPQPVYRWFKGQVLPTVDHLYVLSKLLYVHMEDLLLPEQVSSPWEKVSFSLEKRKRGYLIFYEAFSRGRGERARDSLPRESEGCADFGFREISG